MVLWEWEGMGTEIVLPAHTAILAPLTLSENFLFVGQR